MVTDTRSPCVWGKDTRTGCPCTGGMGWQWADSHHPCAQQGEGRGVQDTCIAPAWDRETHKPLCLERGWMMHTAPVLGQSQGHTQPLRLCWDTHTPAILHRWWECAHYPKWWVWAAQLVHSLLSPCASLAHSLSAPASLHGGADTPCLFVGGMEPQPLSSTLTSVWRDSCCLF